MTRLLWCAIGVWAFLGAQSAPAPTFVDVPIRVIGLDRRPARGVLAADLEVQVDGAPARIESLTPDVRPLSLALIVDTTFSTGASFSRQIRDVTRASVLERLEPGDRVRISGLRSDAMNPEGFSDNPKVLRSSLDALFNRPQREKAGPSPIWDAIWEALEALAIERGRPAVLVATDGRSTGNRHGLWDVLREAIRSGVSIDVFYGGGPDLIPQDGDRVASVHPDVPLRQFAVQSGGELFDGFSRTGNSGFGSNTLAPVLRMAGDQLRHGYLLRLSLPGDGRFHSLTVNARQDGFLVRAPESLYAPAAPRTLARPR